MEVSHGEDRPLMSAPAMQMEHGQSVKLGKSEHGEKSHLISDEYSLAQERYREERDIQGRHQKMKPAESIPLQDRIKSQGEHHSKLGLGSDQGGTDLSGHVMLQKSPKHSPALAARGLPADAAKGKKKLRDLSLKINKPLHALDSVASETFPSARGTPKPIQVCVFLKEGEGRLLHLDHGKVTTAGEMRVMMMENLTLPSSSAHMFALWLVSPHLELQMKDHHIPYLLRKQWRDLLLGFSSVKTQEEALADEPVIVFQRNSFLSVEAERQTQDEMVIRRLFEEAKFNILKERYPVSDTDAVMLGGLLARIDKGRFDPAVHKSGYFKGCLESYLPPRVAASSLMKLMRKSSIEARLIQYYDQASTNCTDANQCRQTFLEFCQQLPFYGCAFFTGSVEHATGDLIPWKSSHDHSIYIGINRAGVTLFKSNRKEVLLHLMYDQLSWDYVKADLESDPDDTDSFLLEYDPPPSGDDAAVNEEAELIQIRSKQACMMDAMVESCVKFMDKMRVPKTPMTADYSRLVELGVPVSRSLNYSLSNPFRFGGAASSGR